MCSARLLLLVALTVAAAGGGRGAGAGAGGPEWCGAGAGGAGADGADGAVVAAAGGAVTLRCCVRRQADRAVSWVRARDLQILAHAGLVFSADTRLTVPRTVAPGPGAGAGAVHLLRIAAVRASDAGRYECQLNTEPKMSQYVRLEVTDHEAEPGAGGVRVWAERAGAEAGGCGAGAGEDGGEDGGEAEGSVLVCAGEAVTLVCEARGGAAPVQWVRPGDTRAVSVSGGSGSGSVAVVSRLRLRTVSARHAGTYWCGAGGGAGGGGAALRVRVTQPGARAGAGGAVPRVESMQRDGAPPPLLAARAPPPPPRPAPAAALALALWLLLAAR